MCWVVVFVATGATPDWVEVVGLFSTRELAEAAIDEVLSADPRLYRDLFHVFERQPDDSVTHPGTVTHP